MKCRGDREPNGEDSEPSGSTDFSDRLEDLLHVGSWTNNSQHPTGELEIPDANGK